MLNNRAHLYIFLKSRTIQQSGLSRLAWYITIFGLIFLPLMEKSFVNFKYGHSSFSIFSI